MIQKDSTISQADISSLISSLNAELNRRNLGGRALSPPGSETFIDDVSLDVIAARIQEIKNVHCYCETNSSYEAHSRACTANTTVLTSLPVDENVIIYGTKEGTPDISDASSDISKLAAEVACSPMCTCETYCNCNTNAPHSCICYGVCGCNSVCECQDDCNCEDHTTCSCQSYDDCPTYVDACTGQEGCRTELCPDLGGAVMLVASVLMRG